MFMLATSIPGNGFDAGLLITALVLGLRHGIDWDHIAAISDITAVNDARGGLRLGTLYALGHAVVVLVLGGLALELGHRLPPSVDDVMGRVAGATLVVLAAGVIVSLARERSQFRMRSRWLILIVSARRLGRATRRGLHPSGTIEHIHDHVAIEGFHHDDELALTTYGSSGARLRAPIHHHVHAHDKGMEQYTGKISFLIGMLHGVGAETPTQLVVFLAAANAGGATTGTAVLAAFVGGLLVSNSTITVVGVSGFGSVAARPVVQATMAVVTTTLSLVVGSALLLGNDSLPSLLTG